MTKVASEILKQTHNIQQKQFVNRIYIESSEIFCTTKEKIKTLSDTFSSPGSSSSSDILPDLSSCKKGKRDKHPFN